MKTFIDFLEAKGEEAREILDEKKWIQGAHLKKGRCTPAPNPDCPVGSRQYALAQRFKHGDLHKKKKS